MAPRQKLTVLLAGQVYLWTFYEAGAFTDLEKHYEVEYLVVDSQVSAAKAEAYGLSPYERIGTAEWRGRFLQWYMMITMFWHGRTIRGFYHKSRRMHPLRRVPYQVLSLPGIYHVINAVMTRWWPEWPELATYLRERGPAMVLMPSIAADSYTLEAINTCKKLGVPSFIIINSWDNLVSKGVMPISPDLVGVWGPQGQRQAIEVQRVPDERIRTLGWVKADYYSGARTAADASEVYEANGIPGDKRILLYASCALPFDDLGAIAIIDKAISAGRYPGYALLYRPHPWMMHREGERRFEDMGFENVYFDAQMRAGYEVRFESRQGAKTDVVRQPGLGYYPKLMGAVSGIVCPLSTIVLEGALCGVQSVLICYADDKNTFLPPSKVIEFDHMKEILGFPGIRACWKEGELLAAVDEMVGSADDDEPKRALVEATRAMVYRDDRPYSVRLTETVREFLE